MAFNVSALSTFTNETKQALIKKAVLQGDTLSYVTKIPGIKYKENLNILDNTITVALQACGWSSAGSVAFKKRTIEVAPLAVVETLCPKTLEKYWLGQLMDSGSPETLDFATILADSYVEKIKNANEINFWAGTTATTSMDGFCQVLTLDGGYVSCAAASGALTAHTAANIITRVDAMVALMPEVLYDPQLGGPVMFMSNAAFRLYLGACAALNYYHLDANVGLQKTWTNPVSGVKFRAVDGLTGKQDLILTFEKNLVVGFDLMNEEDQLDIWYSKDNKEIRVLAEWKIGTQVQFPELVVYNK